jgi:hypothetical protein
MNEPFQRLSTWNSNEATLKNLKKKYKKKIGACLSFFYILEVDLEVWLFSVALLPCSKVVVVVSELGPILFKANASFQDEQSTYTM